MPGWALAKRAVAYRRRRRPPNRQASTPPYHLVELRAGACSAVGVELTPVAVPVPRAVPVLRALPACLVAASVPAKGLGKGCSARRNPDEGPSPAVPHEPRPAAPHDHVAPLFRTPRFWQCFPAPPVVAVHRAENQTPQSDLHNLPGRTRYAVRVRCYGCAL